MQTDNSTPQFIKVLNVVALLASGILTWYQINDMIKNSQRNKLASDEKEN